MSVDREHGYWSETETLAPEARRERQWETLQDLVAHAAAASAEFKARLDRAGAESGDVKSLDDFHALPVLPKKDLMAAQQASGRGVLGGMVAGGLGSLSRIYQSPGPIYDPEGKGPDYWGFAEAFYAAGFRPGDLAQNTFSYHLTPAGLMLEEPLRAIGCAVIPAGPGNTEKQIELMTALPVTGFVGMASYLRVIAEKAVAMGLQPREHFSLRTAFVAAERLPESLRREVEELFGMRVRQGYGTADVGCIAYECPALGGMHLTSRGFVEIVDPQTKRPVPVGETGEVVFTPFVREYPLIRLATGDLSYLVAEPCACGRTSMKLGAIVGRVDDTAKVKGQFIYPSQAAQVVARFPAVSCWRIRVDNPGGKDRLTVCLRAGEGFDAGAFAKAFQDVCKLRPEVELLDADLPEGGARLVDERTFE